MNKYATRQYLDRALGDMEKIFDSPMHLPEDSTGMLYIAHALRALVLEVRLLRMAVEER